MRRFHVNFFKSSRLTKRQYFLYGTGIFFLLALLWPMKSPFPDCYSTLVNDRNGMLLRVFPAPDGQYRFPPSSDKPLPQKYITCLLSYEDRRFYLHPGVDPLSLAGAIKTNIRTGRQVRGGSTLTMQVARLSQPKSRTVYNKLREMWTALRLTVHFSKKTVLREYAAHVPMGGNLIGIETASYGYFGKPAENLTWAESALFVILPNSPSQINLGKKRPLLLKKRNRVLEMLLERNIIDSTAYWMSTLETLPGKKRNFPFEAPHFCEFVRSQYPGQNRINASLDIQIQHHAEKLAEGYHEALSSMGISNLSLLIAETPTGKIRAYIGSPVFTDSLHNGQIDGVQAYRSTGSLLKPFLTARALDQGPYTMQSMMTDVPTYYGTFSPMNASKTYSGLVSLEQCLIRSLNVPMVRLLNQYGLENFYSFLKAAGLKGLFRTANGYGLTLILGGAEANLWELTRLFLVLGNDDPVFLSCLEDSASKANSPLISRGASWLVLNTLSQVSRPDAEFYWQYFNNIPVSWKTGTSYGQKDGWAIGVNPQWTIGVWAGNFTGEGNAALGGAQSAAPLLFDCFNQLCDRSLPRWFKEPENDLVTVTCCSRSGYPAGPSCPETVQLKRPLKTYRPGQCPFHHRYLVDKKTGRSVCSLCWTGADTAWTCRYIVGPGIRNIYQQQGIPADTIPAHRAQCSLSRDMNRLEIVYPLSGIKIFIPRDIDGRYEKIVLSAKHQQNHAHCFWFLNHRYIGETAGKHELALDMEPGNYLLTVQDYEGFSRSVRFTVYRNPS